MFNFFDENCDNLLNENEIIDYVIGVLLFKQKNDHKVKAFELSEIQDHAEAIVSMYLEKENENEGEKK